MSKEEFLDILIECIKNNDYSALKTKTPFEMRLNFFNNGKLYNKDNDNVYEYFGMRGFFENLFTEEEAQNLISSY